MIFCLATTVSAETNNYNNNSIESRYSNNHRITISLDGTSCYAKILGSVGTTSITNGKLVLEDDNGNEVDSWSDLSSYGSTLIVSKTASGMVSGETYTLTISAYVNRNGSSEYVSESITATY